MFNTWSLLVRITDRRIIHWIMISCLCLKPQLDNSPKNAIKLIKWYWGKKKQPKPNILFFKRIHPSTLHLPHTSLPTSLPHVMPPFQLLLPSPSCPPLLLLSLECSSAIMEAWISGYQTHQPSKGLLDVLSLGVWGWSCIDTNYWADHVDAVWVQGNYFPEER